MLKITAFSFVNQQRWQTEKGNDKIQEKERFGTGLMERSRRKANALDCCPHIIPPVTRARAHCRAVRGRESKNNPLLKIPKHKIQLRVL